MVEKTLDWLFSMGMVWILLTLASLYWLWRSAQKADIQAKPGSMAGVGWRLVVAMALGLLLGSNPNFGQTTIVQNTWGLLNGIPRRVVAWTMGLQVPPEPDPGAPAGTSPVPPLQGVSPPATAALGPVDLRGVVIDPSRRGMTFYRLPPGESWQVRAEGGAAMGIDEAALCFTSPSPMVKVEVRTVGPSGPTKEWTQVP